MRYQQKKQSDCCFLEMRCDIHSYMEQNYQNPFAIPMAIIVSGVFIAGAILYTGETSSKGGLAQLQKGVSDTVADTKDAVNEGGIIVPPVDASDHILGNPSAPVVVVEYSDLECPFCARFHETMRQVMDAYGKNGEVAWVYRHFPLEQIHSTARIAAEASECAAELGGNEKFWAFVDGFFGGHAGGVSEALVYSTAASAGLPQDAFRSCVDSKKYADKITEETQEAIAAGGAGTPYSIILARDGTKTPINGALPYANVKTMIDKALQAK